jgi:hypothetical protein
MSRRLWKAFVHLLSQEVVEKRHGKLQILIDAQDAQDV